MTLGFTEITLILLVVLLLFGAKRIPEIARALGKASGEFKRAKDEFTDVEKDAAEKQDEEKKAPTPDEEKNARVK